ncbi:DUF3102 domain-containing protein [Bradyrhizobium sp.]|uniref:DUF3102 domain-containing protein n=1 Tax=Bradyrhizobium sp. TaxID=376 RepID=UPI003BB21F05
MGEVEQVAKTNEESLREIAERIRSQMWRVSQDIVGIGRDLIEARARVGSGKFSAWIEAEFKMSRVTAYKMIKVAETFGETGVNQFTPSVLYALVAPDTTEEVRAEIVGRAKSGERVNVADVEAAKERAKQRAYVVEHGVKALVDAVDRGEVSLSAAVAFVRHQPTVQTALIAKALGSVAEAVTEANAEVKDKADRAGSGLVTFAAPCTRRRRVFVAPEAAAIRAEARPIEKTDDTTRSTRLAEAINILIGSKSWAINLTCGLPADAVYGKADLDKLIADLQQLNKFMVPRRKAKREQAKAAT